MEKKEEMNECPGEENRDNRLNTTEMTDEPRTEMTKQNK
jgi:hypothetical protein